MVFVIYNHERDGNNYYYNEGRWVPFMEAEMFAFREEALAMIELLNKGEIIEINGYWLSKLHYGKLKGNICL